MLSVNLMSTLSGVSSSSSRRNHIIDVGFSFFFCNNIGNQWEIIVRLWKKEIDFSHQIASSYFELEKYLTPQGFKLISKMFSRSSSESFSFSFLSLLENRGKIMKIRAKNNQWKLNLNQFSETEPGCMDDTTTFLMSSRDLNGTFFFPKLYCLFWLFQNRFSFSHTQTHTKKTLGRCWRECGEEKIFTSQYLFHLKYEGKVFLVNNIPVLVL